MSDRGNFIRQEQRDALATVALLVVGLGSKMAQASEREIHKRYARACSEQELQRLFGLYSFFIFHLAGRAAASVLSANQVPVFARDSREAFLHEFVDQGMLPNATQADRKNSRHIFDALLSDFEERLAAFEVRSNGPGVMEDGSLQWEFGKHVAALMNWTDERSPEIGFIGAMVSMKYLDDLTSTIRKWAT